MNTCLLCCGFPFGIFALFIGTALLRVAIILSNRIRGVGRVTPRGAYNPKPDYDDDEYEDDDDWDDGERIEPIPEVNTPRSMGILFVCYCAQITIGVVIGSAAIVLTKNLKPADQYAATVLAQLIATPLCFLTMCGLLTVLLPTRFTLATLVTMMYHVIGITIALVLAIFIGGMALVANLA